MRNTLIISDKEFYLFSEQYKRLQSEKWIDGTIIDCFAVFHINHWKNIVYVQITRHLYWVIILIEKPDENYIM